MEVLDFGMLALGLDMSKASLRKHETTALDGTLCYECFYRMFVREFN